MRPSICVKSYRIDLSVTTITSAAYVEIDSSLRADCSWIEFIDTSGTKFSLGYGAAGAEVEAVKIPAGGTTIPIHCLLNKGMRLSLKTIASNPTTDDLIINLYL